MPEPANSRSLEDILASIRQSLADESVDGLVELSAAAVDAARAEQSRSAHPAANFTLPERAEAAAPVSAADALADDLLRDKLAGALVLETDVVDEEIVTEVAVADAPAPDDNDGDNDLGTDETEPRIDSAALAKLWVLRPGIDQAKPAASGAAQSLSLDPFATRQAPADNAKAADDFAFSPLEILGRATPVAKPVPSMPPLPQAPAPGANLPATPATSSEAAGPPRLDPASVALLEKLRASNAAAIEKIAISNSESDDASAPAAAAPEPEAVISGDDRGSHDDAPAAAEPADAIATEEELRPLLSLPERSTPLFGGQADARPPVTSGLEHLLPEAATAPLQVEDVVSEISAPSPDVVPEAELETAAAEVSAEPEASVAAPISAPAIEPEPVLDGIIEPAAELQAADAPPIEAQAAAPGANKALEDMIAAVLEPVLQRLIETSIGPALESLVRREVERVLKEQRPPE
jgi:hypothetical protein